MRIAIAGATGRTGRLIVQHALSNGHTVQALARQALSALSVSGLTWVLGDIDDIASLKQMIDGSDAVISAVGPRPDRTNVCSVATSHLIDAGAPRLLVISGMGVTLPGDQKSFVDKAVSRVVRLLSPQVFADKEFELEILQRSAIPWTAARIGALSDSGEIKPVKADAHRPPGFAVNTGSLAAFCVSEIEKGQFVRQAPFVAF